MSRTRKRFLLAIVATVAIAASIATGVYAAGRGASDGGVAADSPGAQASIAISNCKAPRTDFITNDTTGLGTTSTTYVDVPGMTKSITQGGQAPSCVLVHVASFAFAQGSGVVEFVRVTLDGNTCNPTETQYVAESGTLADAHAFLCAFANVSPGGHTVTLQHKSFNGSPVFLHRPAMQIDHK
jgi:hypothetical protein